MTFFSDITQARWYANGVPGSGNIPFMQFDYPGERSWDAAVPCKGYSEVALFGKVECKVYSFTDCYYITFGGNPTCSENGCS